MAEALDDTVREALARFATERLRRPLRLGEDTLAPFAESEGGAYFSLHGNALAAECLCQPLFSDADPAPAEAALDLLLALGRGPALPRGAAPPRLEIAAADPREFRVLNGMFAFEGDLSQGVVIQRLRATGQEVARHTGNAVSFRFGGRRATVDIEESIRGVGLDRIEGGVRLRHESEITGRGWLGAPRRLGRLAYAYEIHEEDPTLRLDVTFEAAPGVELRDLLLTTAFDALSEADAEGHRSVEIEAEAGVDRRDDLPEGRTLLPARGARRIRLGRPQGGGIEVRPDADAGLAALRAVGRRRGRLHWVQLRYETARLPGGGRVALAEQRLVLPGSGGEALARMLADPARPRGLDLSPCPLPGAVLNALAQPMLHAGAGHARQPPPARLAALREAFERHLAAFDPAESGAEDLGWTVLALDAAARATREPAHAAALERAAEALLARQGAEDGAFHERPGAGATAEGHATALLACARLAARRRDARPAAALQRGLAALRLWSGAAGGAVPLDTIAVRSRFADGHWGAAAAVESGQLALLLRALRAVQAARGTSAVVLEGEAARRLAFLAGLSRSLLQARIVPAGTALAVRPLRGGGAPTLTTQMLTLLALVPPDPAMIAGGS